MSIIRSRGLSFRKKRKKVTISGAKSALLLGFEIVVVLFISFVIVYFAGMKVTVVGGSMESSLLDGDTVLVNRLTYSLSEPKSGDVIVFLPNGNEKSHYYVKRVVGVPGDKVQIIDGMVYVNGEMFGENSLEEIRNPGLAEEAILVGDEEYFVLGDNVNNSEDSRYANIGNVKKEYITGKAWFQYRSLRHMGRVH